MDNRNPDRGFGSRNWFSTLSDYDPTITGLVTFFKVEDDSSTSGSEEVSGKEVHVGLHSKTSGLV